MIISYLISFLQPYKWININGCTKKKKKLGPSGGIYYPNFVPCFVVVQLNICWFLCCYSRAVLRGPSNKLIPEITGQLDLYFDFLNLDIFSRTKSLKIPWWWGQFHFDIELVNVWIFKLCRSYSILTGKIEADQKSKWKNYLVEEFACTKAQR